MSLNSKQHLFVNSYLQCFNATKAALAAGYAESGAYAHGHKLLKNAEIAAAISQRLSESAMLADEVLARLAEHARCTIEPFVERNGDDITLNLTTEKAKANLHLIKKVSQKRVVRTTRNDSEEEEVTLTIELHDAQSALNTLAKHHGLLIDKSDNRNFDIDLSKLSDVQLERIAKGEDALRVILDGYQSAGKSGGRTGAAAAVTDSDTDNEA